MSAQPRLLYILPDVAYTAELLPAKQPNSYAIHSFRQINGEFITEDEFISENLTKLLDKLEPGEYQVILPDFLFTNTILDVKATNQAQVTDYIKSKLLPSLEINKTTHQIETFVLTEHRGVYKLQLSALEKSLVKPLAQGMADRSLLAANVVSVSWALKSLISLEPSISIVQLGEQLYLTQHYIGLDQAINLPVSEAENLIDTIKTLKGAEPSIQTIYLLTSEQVAEKLRQGLHDTIPLQQLATFSENEGKMPAYLKQAIEASMKTLATPEYELPKFTLEAAKGNLTDLILPKVLADASEVAEHEAVLETVKPVVTKEPEKIDRPDILEAVDEPEVDDEPKVADGLETYEMPASLPSPKGVAGAVSMATVSFEKPNLVDLTKSEADQKKPLFSEALEKEPVEKESLEKDTLELEKSPEITSLPESISSDSPSWLKSKPIVTTVNSSSKSAVIKNKTDVNELMKLITIGVISFVVTVGIGIGLGLGIVLFTNSQAKPSALLSAFASPTPVPSQAAAIVVTPTLAASPSAGLNLAKTKLLIVNATSIPGHAGNLASTLKAAGISQVTTGNAKGDYKKGTYLLTKVADQNLFDFVKTKVGVASLSAQMTIATEDVKGEYTGVIVLAQ